MTIGPGPMIRTDSMSVRLGMVVKLLRYPCQYHSSLDLHHRHESIEQIADVVRTRTRLRMALKAECGPIGSRDALQAAVEKGDMRYADVLRERRGVDGEAVILAGDQHLTGFLVEHGMVGAVMAELHLHRPRARCQAEELMTQADAERRRAGFDDLAYRGYRVVARLRIAGTIGEKDAVGFHREDVAGGRLRRDDGQPATALRKHPKDVVLDAVVVRDNVEFRRVRGSIPETERPCARCPVVPLGARNRLGEIEAGH